MKHKGGERQRAEAESSPTRELLERCLQKKRYTKHAVDIFPSLIAQVSENCNMLEASHHPLLSRSRFTKRMVRYALAAAIIDGLGLAAGAVGYHYLEGLDWLDASLNAAMIMTGNGPVHVPCTAAGKVFAICDALLGVILFVAVVGALLMPVFHRVLHSFHSEHRMDD